MQRDLLVTRLLLSCAMYACKIKVMHIKHRQYVVVISFRNTYRVSSDSQLSSVSCLSLGTFRTLQNKRISINSIQQFKKWKVLLHRVTHPSARVSSFSRGPSHSTFALQTQQKQPPKLRISWLCHMSRLLGNSFVWQLQRCIGHTWFYRITA